MALTFGPLYKDFASDLKKRREDEAAAAAQGIKLAPVGSMQWQGPRVQSAPSQSIWDKTRDIFDANSPMDKFKRQQAGEPVDNPNQSILKNIGNVANEVAKNPMVRYNPLFNPAAIQTAAYDAVRGIKPIDQTGKTAAQQKAEWDAKFGKEVDPNNPNRSYQSPLNAFKQMGAEGLGNIGVGMFSVASGNTAAPSAGELTKAEADQIPGSRKITDARGNSVFVSPTNRPLTAQEEIINGINAKLAFQNPFGAKFAASLSNPVLRTGANMVAEGVQNVAANTLSNLVAPGTQSIVDRLKQSAEDAPMQFASGAPFGLLPNGGKAKATTPSVKLRTDVSTKPAAPDARAIVRGQVEAPSAPVARVIQKTQAEVPTVGFKPKESIKTVTLRNSETGKQEYVARIGEQLYDRAGREAGFKTSQVSPNFKSEAEMQKWISKTVAETPVAKPRVETPTVKAVDTPKPRVAERTAAARSVDEILYGDQPQIKERGRSLAQTLSPDRLIREKITNPLEEAAARVVQRMQTSKNPLARAAVKPLAGFSREAGVTKEVLQAKRYMRGGIEKGKLNREAIAELGDGFSRESRERVWATLDPEQAQKIGLDIPAASQLTPEEVQLQSTLREIIDSTTEGNLRRGLITVEQADKGDYLKRGYSIFEGDAANNKAYKATRKNLLDQYKGRKEITDELIDEAITDPVYLVAKKQAESEAAWAMHDYGSFIVEKGMASPTKRPGYRQLPNNPLYGPAAGQYVPINIAEDFTGFSYDTGIINAFNDLITAYDSLGIRRAKKELLTVFNPAVRAGNQFSNRAVFANMNGINPVQFQKNYLEAGKQIKAKGQYYREAVEQGLTGIDVTQADFHARVAQYADDPNMAQKALDWTKRSYSAADDKARVAAYITWRKRGLSAEEAGRKVQRGFQDYKSVGFFYDMAAKTPLIGNAFVRFAGDAIRIAKNSALDHPLRTAATIMLWSTFVDAMSRFSGESEQDKQTREDRFGAPKIPFTDISMTVQTPMGEINVARFLPFYQLNEIQGPLARFLPIQADPTKPEGWQDPLLGQIAQLAVDKDFRGKSIKDPENTGQFSEPLPQGQELANQARFLATQNFPLGREADSIISAATGQPDIYGKERSLGQAALRAGGIKVEQFGPEQAAKQRSKNQYFDEKAKIDEQLSKMSPAEQEAYKRLTGYYKLREKVPNEFEAGAMRYKKTPVFAFPEDKWKDYTANPNIYSLMEQKKNEEAKRGVPLQPEFDKRLSLEFRKQLINNKSLAPGEDVEADERMYSNPEWDKYQQIKKEYTEKAKKYYPEKDGEFVDELVKHKTADFPQKPAAKVAYDTAYANFVAGKGPKPAFTDAVAQAKEEYTKAKLDWTNNERKARDLPPINPDVWNNVTFGFESDEEKVYKQLKYGKGYGGYGKGGSRKVSMKAPETYGTELRAGATIKKPTVKKIAMPSSKPKTVAIAKPKVSMKKSKV